MATNLETKIGRIRNNVTAALAKIAEKGVTVPEGAGSDDLETLIDAITGGGGNTTDGIALASGTITPASEVELSSEVEHGLGVVPNFMFLLPGSGFDSTVDGSVYFAYFVAKGFTSSWGDVAGHAEAIGIYDGDIAALSYAHPSNISAAFDAVSAKIPLYGVYLKPGVTYHWIVGVEDSLT